MKEGKSSQLFISAEGSSFQSDQTSAQEGFQFSTSVAIHDTEQIRGS